MLQKDHYHLIGIGGIGMSAIAMALLKNGYSVSGSDLASNSLIKDLKDLGGLIFVNHEEKNIDLIKQKYIKKNIIIVTSSAIKKSNIELSYCLKQNLVVKHRSEILSLIMKAYNSIAVAGTHGKTTTSTFLSTLLDLCTKDCSSIIGGISQLYNSNAHIKKSKYLVAEIDESDGTTSNYKSELSIINNIDFDHCDHYSNTQEVISSFRSFAINSEKLLINNDCPITSSNFKSEYQWSIKTKKNIEFAMIPEQISKSETVANYYENGKFIDQLHIPVPGLHNLSNATAAISACRINNISILKIKENIKYLKLPKKRFEYRGEFLKRTIIDDYAHHPIEIKATIELARLIIKDEKSIYQKRLVVIFQPHRFSRVKQFANEFARELANADLIILTDIFSAGEKQVDEINSEIIGDKIHKINQNIKCLKNNYEIKNQFEEITQRNDLIVNMGAGDCHNLWSILNN